MTAPRDDEPDGFLSRWSRRKVQVRQGAVVAEPPPPPPAPAAAGGGPAAAGRVVEAPAAGQPLAPLPAGPAPAPAGAALPATGNPAGVAAAPSTPPVPTLADVAALGRDSDYSRFVAPGVDGSVRNAALQKLFTDPHFNIMDGLDTYIEDYGQPDPLSPQALRSMVQSKALGLFDDDKPPATLAQQVSVDGQAPSHTAGTAPETEPDTPLEPDTHEDADLRLQPDDAAGPARAGAGPEPDAGRQR